GSQDPEGAGRGQGRGPEPADAAREHRGPLRAPHARDRRRRRARRDRLGPRAPRPARHRAPPRHAVTPVTVPLVTGVDSSTQSTKVEVRDAESGQLVGQGRAPHPATSPPRSEQAHESWWVALAPARAEAGHYGAAHSIS